MLLNNNKKIRVEKNVSNCWTENRQKSISKQFELINFNFDCCCRCRRRRLGAPLFTNKWKHAWNINIWHSHTINKNVFFVFFFNDNSGKSGIQWKFSKTRQMSRQNKRFKTKKKTKIIIIKKRTGSGCLVSLRFFFLCWV